MDTILYTILNTVLYTTLFSLIQMQACSQLAEFISLILVQYFIRITQMLVKYCFKILDQYIFAPEFLGSQYFFQVILPVLVKYTVFCQ